jgi:hypothetical protein
MAYRKSIKGNANEANEEFSHNRITIEAGGAGVLLVAFLIVLFGSAIIWLVINYGGLFALSLLALWLVAVAGGIWLCGVYIYSKTGILLSARRRARNHERLIESGEVSFYLQPLIPDFTIYGSSAEHNRALVAPGPQVTVREVPDNTETVLELYDTGATLRTIADSVGMTFYQVQKICSEHRGSAKTGKKKSNQTLPDSSVKSD